MKIQELFAGLTRAHGKHLVRGGKTDSRGKVKGNGWTVQEPVTEEVWRNHLEGKIGLGLVPIRDDNTVRFGAIDIDVYNLDLNALEQKVRELALPLVLCRTKSGGAHLYVFLKEDCLAATCRDKLTEFAVALGYPEVEIFPKQIKLADPSDGKNKQDTGNWINIPYFDAENTLRYAIRDGKPLSLEEFEEYATSMRVTVAELEAVEPEVSSEFADGPPCLQALSMHGFPEGCRNNALFSIGVYCRRKWPDDWRERLDDMNRKVMNPPLGSKEVLDVAKSLEKKSYFYKCNDQPLCRSCNKSLCRTREFGIGGGPSVEIKSLSKHLTVPPLWFADVDGVRIELTTDDLMNQERFRKKCVEHLNKLPVAKKRVEWEKYIGEKIEECEEIEAPEDAGPEGQLWQHLQDFCTNFSQARSRDELLLGRPWTENGMTYFRGKDFMKYLDQEHFRELRNQQIWALLRKRDAVHTQFQLKGKCVQVWGVKEFERQDGDFDVPRTKQEF